VIYFSHEASFIHQGKGLVISSKPIRPAEQGEIERRPEIGSQQLARELDASVRDKRRVVEEGGMMWRRERCEKQTKTRRMGRRTKQDEGGGLFSPER